MKINKEIADVQFANWLKMVIDLTKTKNLYLIGGRGIGKTSDILADRTMDIAHEMPGAPLAFVGDTYINLQKNTVKTMLDGWERLGWREHTDKQIGHYVVDRKPPDYFQESYSKFKTYKHTITIFTGANINLVSMDRPSSGAGNNYVALIGDEVKYLKESKLKKLTPAIRGNYIRFGHSPYFRGRSFTTDYPDPNNIFEDDWIERMEKYMDKKQISDILDAGFVINDINIELIEAEQKKDYKQIKNIKKKLERWTERYIKRRKDSTFFYIASSMVNIDILTEGYFFEQFQDLEFSDYKTSILSIKPKLEKGAMFYGNLNETHFYSDGYNYDYYDQFGLKDNITQNARGLKYLRIHEKLEAGVDFGNMMSMTIGQEQWPYYRVLKFLYVLSPQWIDDLANLFTTFFKSHKHKELDLYYDRSGNAYNKQKRDFATKLKNKIEKQKDSTGRLIPTGWKVNLMSQGQGNITHAEEFDLMNDMMKGETSGLPQLLIDQFEAKELKSSIENAPMEKDSKGNIRKVKKSEKLPIHRLPMESTNASDSFKYLMCRKKYLAISKSRRIITLGDPKVRG